MNQICALSPTVLGSFDLEQRSLLAGTGPPGPGSTIEQVTVSRLDWPVQPTTAWRQESGAVLDPDPQPSPDQTEVCVSAIPSVSVGTSCSWNQTLGIEYQTYTCLPLFSRLYLVYTCTCLPYIRPSVLAIGLAVHLHRSPTSKNKAKQNQPGIGSFSPADLLDAITVWVWLFDE